MTSFHEETSNHCCCQISLPFSCVWDYFLLLVWLNSFCWIRLKKEVSKGWVFKPRLGWCQAHETEYQHCSSLLRAALAGHRARMGWSCCVHKSLRVPGLNPPEIQCSESHRDWEPGVFSLPPKPKQQKKPKRMRCLPVRLSPDSDTPLKYITSTFHMASECHCSCSLLILIY